jgi:hypothetical protein
MIIKSMARKSKSFGQLLGYIDRPQEVGPALGHNLTSTVDDPAALRREFLVNSHLLPERRNGNILYHEVLSFAAADREHLSPTVLEAITRHYLEIRAPYALAYARAHFNAGNPHVHILLSANNVASRQRLRLSKTRFHAIKREMERYQQQHFPELRHSLVGFDRARDMARAQRRAESERQRRGETRLSQKERITRQVQAALSQSANGSECYRQLLREGLRLYRRGKTVGVEYVASGRRYRLKTLGLAESFARAQVEWREVPERLRSLPQPLQEHSRER